MARRLGERLGVVEPHHRGSGLTAGLADEAHRVAVHDFPLLQLHHHLRRLCREKKHTKERGEEADLKLCAYASVWI